MKIKAYKIDAYQNTIEQIIIDADSLDDMYKAIGCSTFASGKRLANGDTLWIDDEGYLNANVTRGFNFAGSFFAGNGLITGGNSQGESVNVKTAFSVVESLTEFAPPSFAISDEMRDKALNSWTITKW